MTGNKKILAACAAAACFALFELAVFLHKPSFDPGAVDEPGPPTREPQREVSVPPPAPEPPAEGETPAAVSLSPELELLGTLVNGAFPAAFIKDLSNGRRGTYSVGSSVRGNRIVEIKKGEVHLDSASGRKVLTMKPGGNTGGSGGHERFVETVSDGNMVIKTGAVGRGQKEIIRELRKIKVRPAYVNKKVNGLRIEGVAEGGIFTSAGIRNNDIIKDVNEQRIDSYQKALQVFRKVRNSQEIKVNIVREGNVKQLSYRLQ